MQFSLIICTYRRAEAIVKLLNSVALQTFYPNEIIIVDGSPDNDTQKLQLSKHFRNLIYYKVDAIDRGLTRQRNFGIQKVSDAIEIICFLDDDTILESNYFEEILKTYQTFPEALGVGGYINNEVKWEFVGENYDAKAKEFYFDGWKRKEGSRFILRKKIGLDSDVLPGFLPEFSHGRSIGFLPPSHKIYEVEQLMGGVSSFKKTVFNTFHFSNYFEGYGLYEDADFTLRVAKSGKLYINTAAQLGHFHDASGRPNQYKYGKMVVQNGWYVWRVKYPNPSFKAKIKWHLITCLLTFIRLTNVITTANRKAAFTESLGRIIGWFSLFLSKPKLN
ncbi:glycosyltransferase family 2 protein [Flavobacterium sp. J27]|uniref:glycosyltransferase family 2 protein n=1 Tax=Flavobacterium sp. J27 TaxID=2060419 RepID=UPI00102F4D68|nr:glycosyltransferase family 2 protein [Flavobacterium sp. J27]